MVASAGIRLGVTGDADVKGVMGQVKGVGVDAADTIGAAFDKAGDAMVAATTRGASATKAQIADQLAAYKAYTDQVQAEANRANDAFRIALAPSNGSSATVGAAAGLSARSSASAIAQGLAQQEAQAVALKAQLDPLGAAQERYNKAIADYKLLAAGQLISEAELTAGQALAKKALDDTTKALGGNGAAAALTTTQQAMLSSVVYRTGESLVSGQPIWRTAAQQGGELAAALSMGPGGAGGAMAAFGGLINPITVLLVASGVGIAAVATAALMHASSMRALTTATEGYGAATGMTTASLEEFAEKGATMADISVASARKMAAAYADTGQIGGENLQRLIGVTQDFANVTGTSSKEATAALAAAFGNGFAGIDQLNSKLDFLSAAEEQHIRNLILAGNETEALRYAIDALKVSIGGASDKTEGWGHIFKGLGDNLDQVGVKIDRLITISPILAQAMQQVALGDFAAAEKLAKLAFGDPGDLTKSPGDQAANAQSLRDKATLDALNPQAQEMADLKGRIAAGLALKTSPSRMAAAGTNVGSVEKDIADSEARLAQLQKESEHIDAHAASLARDTAALEANTAGTLTLAQAYLAGDASALKAEADRKAATDSIKKQGDLQKAQADQLAAVFANQELEAAKQIATLKDQTSAQDNLNMMVMAGVITSTQASQLSQVEAATRPLIIAQLAAVAAGRQSDADALQREIDMLDEWLQKSQQQAILAKTLADTQKSNDNIAYMQKELSLLGASNAERAVQLAQFKVLQGIKDEGGDPTTPANRSNVAAAGNEAATQAQLDNANFVKQQTQSYQDQIDILLTKDSLIGISADDQQKILDQLQLEQSLRERGIGTLSEQGQALLNMLNRQDDLTASVKKLDDAWNEGVQAGDKMINDLFAGGNVVKNEIKDIAAELLKLSLINPFENWAFGQNLPTAGGVFSALSKGVGGGGGIGGLISSLLGGPINAGATSYVGNLDLASLAGYANGTDGAPAGWAWTGENGRELTNMVAGQKVINHGNSMKMVADALKPPAGQQPISITYAPVMTIGSGADPQAVAQLQAQFDQQKRELPSLIVGTIRDAHDRGMNA